MPAFTRERYDCKQRNAEASMAFLPDRAILAIAAVIDIAIRGRAGPVCARGVAARNGLSPRHLEPSCSNCWYMRASFAASAVRAGARSSHAIRATEPWTKSCASRARSKATPPTWKSRQGWPVKSYCLSLGRRRTFLPRYWPASALRRSWRQPNEVVAVERSSNLGSGGWAVRLCRSEGRYAHWNWGIIHRGTCNIA